MKEIEKALKENGVFIGKTQGDSMFPMLVAERDIVVIKKPVFPLKKYDVPVYRNNGHYTMHRIVKVTRKGYVVCGDNRTHLERNVIDDDIVGVLTAFYCNGEFVKCTDKMYVKYVKKVYRSLPWRRIKAIVKHITKKIENLSF